MWIIAASGALVNLDHVAIVTVLQNDGTRTGNKFAHSYSYEQSAPGIPSHVLTAELERDPRSQEGLPYFLWLVAGSKQECEDAREKVLAGIYEKADAVDLR